MVYRHLFADWVVRETFATLSVPSENTPLGTHYLLLAAVRANTFHPVWNMKQRAKRTTWHDFLSPRNHEGKII